MYIKNMMHTKSVFVIKGLNISIWYRPFHFESIPLSMILHWIKPYDLILSKLKRTFSSYMSIILIKMIPRFCLIDSFFDNTLINRFNSCPVMPELGKWIICKFTKSTLQKLWSIIKLCHHFQFSNEILYTLFDKFRALIRLLL